MNITITVSDQAMRAVTASLRAKLANPQPLLKDLGEEVVQRAKARFSSSTGPDGQRWKPKKQADGRPTLVGESGDLRRQIVWRVAGGVLTIQATPRYAAIHQFGGTIERAAFSKLVRHRTDAKGQLLRNGALGGTALGGKGLVFAKLSHKRVKERWFEVQAHSIRMPARPFLPVQAGGTLFAEEQRLIQQQVLAWLGSSTGGSGPAG